MGIKPKKSAGAIDNKEKMRYHILMLEDTNFFYRHILLPKGLIYKEGTEMMPLTMAETSEQLMIKKIGGKPETRQFLENLGFIVGGEIMIISRLGGNVIVSVKDSRVAVSKEMAQKIMV